jgi:hypothetical protein
VAGACEYESLNSLVGHAMARLADDALFYLSEVCGFNPLLFHWDSSIDIFVLAALSF